MIGAGKLKQPVLEAERHSKERQKERRKVSTCLECILNLSQYLWKTEKNNPPLLFMVLSIQEVVASLLLRLSDKWFQLSH